MAIDGSTQADQSIEYAVQLTKKHSSKLALLHVEEDELIRVGGPQVVDCVGTIGEYLLKDASTKTEGVTFEKLLGVGSPAETVIKVAKKRRIDLIVVGSRGLSSIIRLLLDSVSGDISLHARVLF